MAHPGPYHLYLIPHSHLDVEWYWTFDKTRTMCRTIFRDALQLLANDPGEAFSQDQVPLAELLVDIATRDDAAVGLAALKEWMRDGRFEFVGGTYVQPEVAEPHGECLVRQLLIGRRRVRELVDAVPRVGWFIDTFGQVPQIAQILVGCGMDSYVFERGVPNHLPEPPAAFWYQSPDGTRILTAWISSGYCTTHDDLARTLRVETDHASTPHVMIPWGSDVSNPAQMPAADAARHLRELADRERVPVESICVATPSTFFRNLREQADALPVLQEDFAPPDDRFADLRGTYANRVRLKIANRKAEQALLAAESWAALAAAYGIIAAVGQAEALWPRLYNHFHDIIGGSCTDSVYLKAMQRLGTVIDVADDITDRSLSALAEHIDTRDARYPVAVFNGTSTPRTDVVQFEMVFRDEPHGFRVLDDAGDEMPHVILDRRGGRPGAIATALVSWLARDVPSFGYHLFRIEPTEEAPDTPDADGAHTIENAALRVSVDPTTGDVTEVADSATGRNFLSDRGNEIIARREQNPSMEGALGLTGEAARTRDVQSVEVTAERTRLFQSLRATTRFLDCALTREVRLYADIPRLHFRTTFDGFRGADVYLSVRFPFALEGDARVVYETPYAMTDRTPAGGEHLFHCAQTVVDIGDGRRGAALVNTGNAGYWPSDDALELILFRSVADFPDYHAPLAAEHGTHGFEYLLLPHDGGWREGGVVPAAHAVNRPLRAHLLDPHTGAWGPTRSLVTVDEPNVEVSAIKWAYSAHGGATDDPCADRAVVVRLYETHGRSTVATVAIGFPARRVWSASLEERRRAELPVESGKVRLPLRGWEIGTLVVEVDTA